MRLAWQLGSAALLAVLSAVIVRAMTRVGALDHPGARSSHTVPTPKGGGVGIVAAFLAGMMILFADQGSAGIGVVGFAGLNVAAAMIAAVSYADDVRSWSFVVKLGAQILAAMIAIACGLRLQVLQIPGLGPFDIGLYGIPLTAAWIVFVTNAVNFIDGLNGLAGGSALIAALFLGCIAGAAGDHMVQGAAFALAAGLCGFLPFNFPRARIFMGDVGSQFCGFVLAVLGVLAAGAGGRLGGQPGDGTISVLLVPMLLFGVLFDVVVTLARRLLAGEVLTQAHRSHLYQIAERCGVPAEAVTLVHWAMTAWGGVIFIAAGGLDGPWKAALPIAVIPPQIAWLAFVVGRARKAGLERW